MNKQTVTLVLLALSAASGHAHAADLAHGKQLQQASCTSCHGDEMYTRDNRKVTTLDALDKQVRRCELTLGLKWFDEDIEAVTGYLNDSFYKFR